jgi:DNA-binding transcriptional ArsR family regulator
MLQQRVAKDLPLSELTLRRYERPSDIKGRELVKRLCLSMGLLQPGDSRDVIVDILMVMLEARKQKEELESDAVRERVIEMRKRHNIPLLGIAHSNVRRQLKRLKDVFLIESNVTKYRITEFMSLSEVFAEKGESYLLNSILQRVWEYMEKVDEEFGHTPDN